jgi:hypothetical protein
MDRNDSRTESTVGRSVPTTLVRALRIATALSVLMVVWQGATAGELISNQPAALRYHQAGAIVLHVVTAAAAIAAFLLRRRSGGPLWPSVLGVVIFVCTLVQAAVGDAGVMSLHVPMALVLMLGSAVLLAWSFLVAPGSRVRSGTP